ncbi:MvdC/MvdD family ATP grasp protein [Actinoalloteichus sp. GBA129-24]|uniref:MvdC/MvdD family ATP grasp protein n=1 Tax=Actinoalloteichus sp. GBA129-24 TaxID=1612551 RepID=UPI0009503F96|nr:hypothetical protein [Actinoalloteichus sp. GBA129-24]APU22592.1 hypothetical protein UA75_23050 [Actinoalloteichus sp. GBA129-24]
MTAATIAVITRDQDITADLVIAELAARGVAVTRFDVAAFPERLEQVSYLEPGHREWTGTLRDDLHELDLSVLRAIWYRKPAPFVPYHGLSSTERRWAVAEAFHGFGGLLASLNVHWISRPDRIAAAGHKPLQMALAAAAGLTVPPSLLTNSPDAAREFCVAHSGGVIYKPLDGGPGSESGRRVALRAAPVTADDITAGVRRTTHLFQARVPCAYSVRLAVVGRRFFATRIDLPAGTDTVDWRAEHARLQYTPIGVPDDVSAGVSCMLEALGLNFAAPDFVVDHDGRWHFIGDLNPNGQWAWIDALRGPVTVAMADELIGEGPS